MMLNPQRENNEDWKKELRIALANAITGNSQLKEKAQEQIGYYYMCYAPTFLYKYYSDKPTKLEAVQDNKMWYSAPYKFNDAFDCDLFVDENAIFTSFAHLASHDRGVRAGSPAWRRLKQTIHAQACSMRTTFEDMKVTTGISCLSELDNSLLMWAHYANNHRGMCVEYELLEINRQLKFSPIPVVYSDEKVRISSIRQEKIEVDATRFLIESLTTKSTEWSYEKEWRIIRDNVACGLKWDVEEKGALLDMIRPSSVILGCMAELEFEQSVYAYCEERRINLFKMKKNKEFYRLEKIPILQFEEQD